MGGPKWGPTVSLLFLKSAAPGSPGPTPDTQQPSRGVNPSPVMGNFSPSHMELTPLQTLLHVPAFLASTWTQTQAFQPHSILTVTSMGL